MKVISVDYFDGTSSKSHQAQLTIYPNYWSISYVDESDSLSKEVRWDVRQITPSKVYTKGLVSFNYGEYPFRHVETDSENILLEIKRHEQQKHLLNKYDNILHALGYKSLIGIVALIVGISCFMYFYVLPSAAVKFVETIDEEYVVGFGEYVFNPIKDGLDIDEERSEKLQEFFDALDMESNYHYEVYVVDVDMLNAFAVSGGKIVVFSGLLDELKNSNQLAALLGHEKTHVENRHVLKNLARDLSGYLFLSILFGDINGITTVLMENAHMFKRMNYSRGLEKEADEGGYGMLLENSINPEGLVGLFEVLKTESISDGEETFKYFSSHPMLQERIDYVQSRIDESDINYEKDEQLEVLFKELKQLQGSEEHNNNGNE